MENADVVVVGGGPSGASAAYFLASRGIDVVLVDKGTFPREKTCGDGLGPRSLQMLDKMGLGDWLDSNGFYRCDRIRLFSNSGAYFESRIPSEDTPYPHFCITSRKSLDQKLIDTAKGAGARVREGCKATGMIVSGGAVRGVKVDGGEEISCKVVVCADGTHGTFARHTGIECVKPHAFAVRAYYEGVQGLDDCINIYLDERISEGYAWIFPTSTTSANIGIGLSTRSMRKRTIDIRELLNWFMTEKNAGPLDLGRAVPVTDVKGAYLRMGYGRHDVLADGVVLTGDAAGLINPLSGEGIAYALESGEVAAAAIKHALDKGDVSSGALALYRYELNKRFLWDHRIYEFLRESLAKPAWMDRAVERAKTNPDFAGTFVSVMMSTARPLSLFNPRMLIRYLGPG